MMRFVAVGLLSGWVLFGSSRVGWGQSPAELAETARFAANHQNPDGGFAPKGGGTSTLGATSSGIRILGYVAGSVRDVPGAIRYVKSCYDDASGGFAPTPGGKPDIGNTASGLMALVALRVDTKPYADKAVAYLGKEAKSYEEVRISIAALEAIKTPSPDFPRWTAEVINADRNPNGTYGTGAGQARATGGATAALLRMGLTIEPEQKAAILAVLRAGQKPDGAWGEGEGASDLGSSYRIMRAFFMMKEKPDLARLRGYLAKLRQSDGGYAPTPGGTPDISATYYAMIMTHWARLLDGERAVVETAGFSPLFNGKDLNGWEGDTSLWSARDGMIVGDSPGIKHNQFLATEATYADFILKFSVRLVDDSGNSGVMFRSVRLAGTEMSGYQTDVGPGYWGGLYDESRRNRELVHAGPKALAALNKGGWNHVVVRALGNHIVTSLNDQTSVDYRETDPSIARDGKIALQIHSGGPMRVEYKDILIQPLPIAKPEEKVGATAPGFHIQPLKTGGDGRKYVVYVPKGYDGSKAMPVILFLHGSGERGDDGLQSAQIGLGAAIEANPDRFRALVVLPQATKTWAGDSDDAKAALAALDEVIAAYKVDPTRQILTGLSMGGSGAFSIATAYSDRFAAVVPICGRGKVESAETIKGLPIWTVVGDLDGDATVQNLRSMAQTLRDLGASVHQTEYREVGHNSWDRAYNDPTLVDWMLNQARKSQ